MGEPIMDPCLVCGGATAVIVPQTTDFRFGAPGTYSVRECPACGAAQTWPRPDAATLKSLYETYYNSGGEGGTGYGRARERFLLSPLYRLFLAIDGDISFHAERGSGRLLDVGCNEGRGLTLYQRNGFAAEGLELNETAAAEARARGFAVATVPIEEFHPPVPFDVVIVSNVLEHALDPRAMLGEIRRLLRPGGEVWISLPNRASWLRRLFGAEWINWHVPYHITHFQRAALLRLLDDSGFTAASLRDVTPALWAAQSAIAWATRARADRRRWLRNAKLVAAAMAAARFGLFPLLWLGNRMGRGDCLVVKATRR